MKSNQTEVTKESKIMDLKDFRRDYVVEDKILGDGAFGVVFRGVSKSNYQDVAIKKIQRKLVDEREWRNVRYEVGILRSIQHKNVVQLLGFYEGKNEAYMVMECVSGGDLFQQIVEKELKYTETSARGIIKTLVEALKYCLDLGIIHRDLKPENILVAANGDIKLADFGFATQVNPRDVTRNLLKESCGTLNYMAPEILAGKHNYNYKCDVWSVGVITYVLLSGGVWPFYPSLGHKKSSSASEEVKQKIIDGMWDFEPDEVWEPVTDLAKTLLSDMMDIDPDRRIGYEDILKNEWMTSTTLPTDNIDHEELNKEVKRKALRTAKIGESVTKFMALLSDDSTLGTPDEQNAILQSGSGAFSNLESADQFLNL